jgi:hypothetical protein
MKKVSLSLSVISLVLSGIAVHAQSVYNAQAAFAPIFYPHNGNQYRSADGSPGPDYWQNNANYHVHVRFDTATKLISGEVKITYTNNSPHDLSYVWLELDQNIDKEDSRANSMRNPSPPVSPQRGDGRGAGAGFHIQNIAIVENGRSITLNDYIINDTRMQVWLPQALKAKGGKLQMMISYDYTLQRSGGGGRSGYLSTENGVVYDVSYWYPRMEVYDDLAGWNTLPFLGGGEFYLDYGNIDYTITLPAGMIVAGAGQLMNPEEVLTKSEIRQLNKAKTSDKTIIIRTPENGVAATHSSADGWLTWHFHMENTRDVAWAASSAFIWDAARIDLPPSAPLREGGKTSLAMSFYPVESKSDSSWGRATEYTKGAIEIFSKSWFPYPYPTAVSIAGPVGGMEFPGLTFDWWKAGTKSLYAVLSHEIGHSWFPMIVGSDERRYAWMDEGFNTFVDIYAQQEFNHGEYAPKRDGEYARGGGNPAEEIIPFITGKDIPPIKTFADAIPNRYVHPLEYFKTAFGLVLLREVILGHERFDKAFRKYISDWAYKHPSPWDFFREMDNNAGENLAWFWRSWFFHNWQLDQAVEGVKYVDNDPSKGALITIENLGKMPMPVLVEVTESNGQTTHYELPVETWEQGAVHTFKVNTTIALKSVILDPDKKLPDVNRANNIWNGPGKE